MSVTAPKPPVKTGMHWRDRGRGMDKAVLATAAIYPPHENDGWVQIATYPLTVAGSKDYQSAHAQAFTIRSGKRAYIKESGLKFDARITRHEPHALILWVRCLGEDGKRWEQ